MKYGKVRKGFLLTFLSSEGLSQMELNSVSSGTCKVKVAGVINTLECETTEQSGTGSRLVAFGSHWPS